MKSVVVTASAGKVNIVEHKGARNKDYRIIKGWAYTQINHNESDQTLTKRELAAAENLNHPNHETMQKARKIFYHSRAIRLKPSEVKAMFNNFNIDGRPAKVPLGYGHEEYHVCGEILSHSIKANGIWIEAKVHGQTDVGKHAIEHLDNREKASFSINYDVYYDNEGKITAKNLKEITLCGTPFFDGCHVQVIASLSAPSKTKKSKPLRSKFPNLLKTKASDSLYGKTTFDSLTESLSSIMASTTSTPTSPLHQHQHPQILLYQLQLQMQVLHRRILEL